MSRLQTPTQMRPRLDPLLSPRLVKQPKRTQPNSHVLLPNRLRQLIHELQDKRAPLLRRTPILIGPFIDIRAEELLRQVPVRAVDLNTVEADRHRVLRGPAVVLDRPFDVRHGELDRGAVDVADLFGRPDGDVWVSLVGRVPGSSGG